MPLKYLLSGGVSMRSLMPGIPFGLWGKIESFLEPWNKKFGMLCKHSFM